MKNNFYVEYEGKQVSEDTVIQKVKELWVEQGNKIKDIKTCNIYFKVEDSTAYCIINDNIKIDIKL